MPVDSEFLPATLTDEETVEAGADSGTDSERGTVSNIVTETYEENYGLDSECNISRHQILLGGEVITPVYFLCSRIANKDTFYRFRR